MFNKFFPHLVKLDQNYFGGISSLIIQDTFHFFLRRSVEAGLVHKWQKDTSRGMREEYLQSMSYKMVGMANNGQKKLVLLKLNFVGN